MTLPADARIRAVPNFLACLRATKAFMVEQDARTAEARFAQLQGRLAKARELLAFAPAISLGHLPRLVRPASPRALQRLEDRRLSRGTVAPNARLRVAATAGVDFVLGTDANGSHVGFGDELLELARMAEVLGWPAERVLQAATSRAAAAIGRSDLGRVEPGAKADLVIVRGEPWRDLAVLRPESIVAVLVRGTVVHGAIPADLRATEAAES